MVRDAASPVTSPREDDCSTVADGAACVWRATSEGDGTGAVTALAASCVSETVVDFISDRRRREFLRDGKDGSATFSAAFNEALLATMPDVLPDIWEESVELFSRLPLTFLPFSLASGKRSVGSNLFITRFFSVATTPACGCGNAETVVAAQKNRSMESGKRLLIDFICLHCGE